MFPGLKIYKKCFCASASWIWRPLRIGEERNGWRGMRKMKRKEKWKRKEGRRGSEGKGMEIKEKRRERRWGKGRMGRKRKKRGYPDSCACLQRLKGWLQGSYRSGKTGKGQGIWVVRESQGRSGKMQKWLESQGNFGENFTFLYSCCNANNSRTGVPSTIL